MLVSLEDYALVQPPSEIAANKLAENEFASGAAFTGLWHQIGLHLLFDALRLFFNDT